MIETIPISDELLKIAQKQMHIYRFFQLAFALLPITGIIVASHWQWSSFIELPVIWLAPATIMLMISLLLTYRLHKTRGSLASEKIKRVTGIIAKKQVVLGSEPIDKISFTYEVDSQQNLLIQQAQIYSSDGSNQQSIKLTSRLNAPRYIHSNAIYQFYIDDRFWEVTPIVFINYHENDKFEGYYLNNDSFIIDSKKLISKRFFNYRKFEE